MLHKSCPLKVKAVGEPDGMEDGQFEAIVSVFGNKDSYGDVVQPGAFTDSLAEWETSGSPIPVLFSHRMDDPNMNIGHVLEAKETDRGLWIKAQLDLEMDNARTVNRQMKGRRLQQFSFAYDVVEGGWEKENDEEFYSLRKLRLYEIGPTLIGANPETELLAVKAASEHARAFVADVKAGRVPSAKNETTLREALVSLEDSTTQIKTVLSALESTDDDQAKANGTGTTKDEEPAAAKSEESSPNPSARNLATLTILGLAEGAERGST